MDKQIDRQIFKKKLSSRKKENLNGPLLSTTDLPKTSLSSESTGHSESSVERENDSSSSFGDLSRTSYHGPSRSDFNTGSDSIGINMIPCHTKEGAKWTKIRMYQERNKRREEREKRERKKEREGKKKQKRKKKSGTGSQSSSSSSSSSSRKKKSSPKKKNSPKKKSSLKKKSSPKKKQKSSKRKKKTT